MMVTCRPFSQMFKLAVLVCSLKSFMLNFLSPLYKSKLKPFYLYMLVTFWSSLMILYILFEIKKICCKEGYLG